MSAPLRMRRLAALTILFIGLLVAFSALGFAAQNRGGPAAIAAVAGLAICALGGWRLRLLPPVLRGEHGPREPTP